jgi:hypothetical protein
MIGAHNSLGMLCKPNVGFKPGTCTILALWTIIHPCCPYKSENSYSKYSINYRRIQAKSFARIVGRSSLREKDDMPDRRHIDNTIKYFYVYMFRELRPYNHGGKRVVKRSDCTDSPKPSGTQVRQFRQILMPQSSVGLMER